MRWIPIMLLATLPWGLGCEKGNLKSTASLTYTEDAFKAYQEALEAYENSDWEDARALFSQVKRLFTYSRYARLAELRIADIDFELTKYSDAIGSYRSFIKGHREDDNVEYAKYRIAKALFLDINDTVFLPPQEERDQANAREAYKELLDFADRYPLSRYRVDSSYMLEVVTQRLARHELYVAHYYLKKDNFRAAVFRVDYVLAQFPGSGLDAEALTLKGETLLKWHKRDLAREVFELVVTKHGGPFGGVAKRFLAEMDRHDSQGGASPGGTAAPEAVVGNEDHGAADNDGATAAGPAAEKR